MCARGVTAKLRMYPSVRISMHTCMIFLSIFIPRTLNMHAKKRSVRTCVRACNLRSVTCCCSNLQQRQLADRNMCGYCRGYWTLCPGEVTLRFHTSISLGLSTSAHQALSGKCNSNKLPASLPELAPATLAAAGLLRLLRPAVLTAGALAGTQCSKASHRPFAMVAVGLCVAVLGASSVLDRFVVAVEQLRRHLLAAVPACLAEAEKTVLATRGGCK